MAIQPLPEIAALAPYAPGRAIAEIQEQFGLTRVIKLASNENPLGAPPLAQEAIRRNADRVFLYPQGGNPRLARALAARHDVAVDCILIGNGSDEIIDLLMHVLARPGRDNILCFEPCFSIYPIQAAIAGIEARRIPLKSDFSFDFAEMLAQADAQTRLVFITTPDNPSGYCPPLPQVLEFAQKLAQAAPGALLVIDEAYMDFVPDERGMSCLASAQIPANAALLRTFSKSFGLAGLRLGYAVAPPVVADAFWRARLPFSVNILAEEAGLAALADDAFRSAVLETVARGREQLRAGLRAAGCQVWPSCANFLMFSLPGGKDAGACFDALLREGIIIRPLASYNLPLQLRVSVGTEHENAAFLAALNRFLAG